MLTLTQPAHVDDILKPLAKLVKRLEAHSESKLLAQADHLSEQLKHTRLADLALSESIKARSVAEKIGALLS